MMHTAVGDTPPPFSRYQNTASTRGASPGYRSTAQPDAGRYADQTAYAPPKNSAPPSGMSALQLTDSVLRHWKTSCLAQPAPHVFTSMTPAPPEPDNLPYLSWRRCPGDAPSIHKAAIHPALP